MPQTRSVSLTGLLTAAGLIAGLASLTAFLGSFWWIFELTSHFRVQYALTLIIFSITLLWLRQWRVSATLAVIALLNLVVIAPHSGRTNPRHQRSTPGNPHYERCSLMSILTTLTMTESAA
ncbi:MAG: hypothetical protein HC889_00915 [Synechococcaceae cyanobacterium SM1_2_3]|nr:hypothetical protein [Synechococcaceae cyanobacterium SM1_2_3]